MIYQYNFFTGRLSYILAEIIFRLYSGSKVFSGGIFSFFRCLAFKSGTLQRQKGYSFPHSPPIPIIFSQTPRHYWELYFGRKKTRQHCFWRKMQISRYVDLENDNFRAAEVLLVLYQLYIVAWIVWIMSSVVAWLFLQHLNGQKLREHVFKFSECYLWTRRI